MIFPNFSRFCRQISSIFPDHFCAKLNVLRADMSIIFGRGSDDITLLQNAPNFLGFPESGNPDIIFEVLLYLKARR